MKIGTQTVIKMMLGLLAMVIILHLLILIKIIPYNIAWGGRLQNDEQMYVFEFLSVMINLFLAWVLLHKTKIIKSVISNKAVEIILWAFLILFIANTIGNLLAKTTFERYFSLLTLILAGLIFLILRSSKALDEDKSPKSYHSDNRVNSDAND